MKLTPKKIIKLLNLEPLQPEGGYFRQTYKDKQRTKKGSKTRSIGTAIYYLITEDSFSTFHRISSTEIFHYYAGSSVEMFQITKTGKLKKTILGPHLNKGERPQVIIPPNIWQAAKLKKNIKIKWALIGTTVCPGFKYEDFEIGKRKNLISQFPKYRNQITELTCSE